MLLTCPNCEAEYEVPDGMVPAAGRHVQCTNCHTRWFARGTSGAAPTEEQILSRLEARPQWPEPDDAARLAATLPGPAPVIQLRPRLDPATLVADPEPDVGTVREPEPEPEPLQEPKPTEPRVAPRRLDLGPPTTQVPLAPPPASGRFGIGLILAPLLFLIGLAVYDSRDAIAESVPAAEPALKAYGNGIDDLRVQAEQWIAPLRAGRTE